MKTFSMKNRLMNNMFYPKLATFLIFLMATSNSLLLAQVKRHTKNDTIKTNDVFIVKEYEPTVITPKKIEDYPNIIEPQISPPSIKYALLTKQYPVTFNILPIKPAYIRGEPLIPLTKGYFKGGLGNYKNTLANLFITTGRSRKHLNGIHIAHLGSGGNLSGWGKSNFSNNQVDLFSKKFLRQHLLSGNITYNFDNFHFYGYHPDSINLTADSTRQQYHQIGGQIGITSFFKDTTAINYESSIAASYITENRFKTKEWYIKTINNFKKKLNGEQLMLNSLIDINQFMQNTTAIVKVNPEISSKGTHYQADVGLNVYVNAASITRFYFYPNVQFKYNLYKEYIIPYAGLTGNIRRTNLHTLYNQNPFIAPTLLTLNNTIDKYIIYGGIKGAYSSTISFDIKAIKKKQNYVPLFTSSLLLTPSFNVIYDNLSTTELSAEITWQKTEKLDFILHAQYFSYRLEKEFLPWYLPDYQLKSSFQYDIADKILLRGQFFVISPRKAKTYNPAEGDFVAENIYAIKLPAIYDFNIGVEYRYTKKLSAFLNINNIASMKYYQWQNYPVQGLNVLGGINYSFLED